MEMNKLHRRILTEIENLALIDTHEHLISENVRLFGLIWGRKGMSQRPVATFFFVSYLVATLFFIGWGIYWRGLPQFSEVGLI